MGSLSTCNISPDGTINGAEQFWNCAEVQIFDGGSPGSPQTPSPTSPPTSPPVNPTTPAPTTPNTTNNPTAAPSMSPTQAPVVVYGNYCGSSWTDAGQCGIPCPTGNSTVCGYGQHCYADVTCTKTITNAPTESPTNNTPVQSPTKSPTEGVGTCGGGNVGNGVCANPAHCCSKWGYCGSGDAWCGRRRGLRAM